MHGPRPRTTVFVNRYFYPDHAATAQMLSDLAFGTARSGREVVVITSRQRLNDSRAQLPPDERVHGVRIRRVWSSRFGRAGLVGRALDYLSFHLSAAIAVWLEARRGDTVVAATDPPMLGVSVGWGARWRGARLVNWLHDRFPEVAHALGVPGTGGVTGRVLGALMERALGAAHCNVVIGTLMARQLQAAGVAPARIRIIHNWSDGDAVRPIATESSELRSQLGLDGKFVVAYSGNLGRAHDLGALPEAARALDDLDDLVFLFIGGGAGIGPLREALHARGVSNAMFVPYQPRDRLADVLAAGDVHLLALRPSLEGLIVPSKLYGILAAGRPALNLGDPAGEVGQILAGAGCGISVHPGDVAGLASALRRLHDDHDGRRAMGRSARALLLERFELEQALRAWGEVLA